MHGAMIPLSRGCEIRAGGYMCRIFIIFTGMKNRGAYQDASRFLLAGERNKEMKNLTGFHWVSSSFKII